MTLRRYCATNGLNRLGTLTYAPPGCHDQGQFREDVGRFFRRLRRSLGGEAFAYAWVPEWHKSGHGLHGHFAVGQFIGRQLVEDAWGHGFIKMTLIGDLPVGSGRVEEARVAGRYLAKYVGKDFGHGREEHRHRYDVAQGFKPVPELVTGRTLNQALDAASLLLGGRPPVWVWDSSQEQDWQGPPAVSARWAV